MLKYHIQTIEVAAGGASSINFTNIPQGFTDLVLKASLRQDQGNPNAFPFIRFNGSSADLSSRYLAGTGSSTFSGAVSGLAFWNATKNGVETSNTFTNDEIYIPNYTGSNQKSFSLDSVMENNGTDSRQWLMAGLWANTSPITSITIFSGDNTASPAFSFLQNSSISLYGVRRGSDGVTLPAAQGGIVTTSGGYTIHTFNSSGTFTAFRPLQCEYLVVAGGGGGGRSYYGGGGGAGGYRSSVIGEASGGGSTSEPLVSLASGQSYSVTVGAGGASFTNGSTTSFAGITTIGGGRGGSENGGLLSGASGGSGGGRSLGASDGGIVGAGTANQGFAGGGGNAPAINNGSGGGGGGAGSVGVASLAYVAGNGGNGLTSSITGSAVARAGGGGGAGFGSNTFTQGLGQAGGGNGAIDSANPGAANTGSGGGGRGADPSGITGGAGGSGVVIIRYLTP
jgi:hypothetical protein